MVHGRQTGEKVDDALGEPVAHPKSVSARRIVLRVSASRRLRSQELEVRAAAAGASTRSGRSTTSTHRAVFAYLSRVQRNRDLAERPLVESSRPADGLQTAVRWGECSSPSRTRMALTETLSIGDGAALDEPLPIRGRCLPRLERALTKRRAELLSPPERDCPP
jgi:hypothetical protein